MSCVVCGKKKRDRAKTCSNECLSKLMSIIRTDTPWSTKPKKVEYVPSPLDLFLRRSI